MQQGKDELYSKKEETVENKDIKKEKVIVEEPKNIAQNDIQPKKMFAYIMTN